MIPKWNLKENLNIYVYCTHTLVNNVYEKFHKSYDTRRFAIANRTYKLSRLYYSVMIFNSHLVFFSKIKKWWMPFENRWYKSTMSQICCSDFCTS